ncbi:MAG: hypothetical protein ABIP97_02925, partial [Chthoniobacterales bacterium]
MKLALAVLVTSVLAVAQNAGATDYSFSNALTGPQNWTDALDWAPATSPTGNSANAIINRTGASGDVTITTPGTVLTLGQFNFTAVSGSGLTVSLANDVTLVKNASVFGGTRGSINNATGDVTKMVFDLNGYTLDTVGIPSVTYPLLLSLTPANSTFTVKSTGNAGGTMVFADYAGKTSIQNNTTVWVRGTTASTVAVNTASTTFSAASTFVFSGGNANDYHRSQMYVTGNASGNDAFANLVIGDTRVSHDATAVNFSGTTGSAVVVRGNLTLAQNSDLYLGYASSLAAIKVGGNYSDAGGGMYTTY